MIRQAAHIVEKGLDSYYLSGLPAYFGWLSSVAPKFSLNGNQVSVLHKPEEFYETLLERCKSAKSRISLASLYLGTGPLETKLVQAIDDRLSEKNDLQVSILLDANRGSRGVTNSRKLLLPLINNYPHCQVSLFHTPSLRAPLKYLLPQRYNELVGLQHMKLYVFDDSVIISGANLSDDYFTNRQDRYVVISDCKELADFYFKLIQKVSSISLGLDKSDNLTPRTHHPYKEAKESFVKCAKENIWKFYQNKISENKNPHSKRDHDTWVFPLIEFPPFGIHHDSQVTKQLLEDTCEGSKVTLSTGYFNLTDDYSNSIIYRSQAIYRILMAHPSANGFLTAGGLAGAIPGAYTGLAMKFLRKVKLSGEQNRITMFEYMRKSWTFHAKGLWYTPPLQSKPVMTLVGSSNFGSRSVGRDLESQLAIVTLNETLQSKLKEEEDSLFHYSSQFTEEVGAGPERKPKLWVQTSMWLFRTFF